MKLPLISLPTVYHVGTLNPADRGTLHKSSHEGAWLSASLCQNAWRGIAHLGDAPTWALCNPRAYYLDVLAMPASLKGDVMQWASEAGLIKKTRVFTVSYFDSEANTSRYSFFSTRAEAELEQENIEDVGDVARIGEENIWTLMPEGRARVAYGDFLWPADDFAIQFWVEDVLPQAFPQVFGLYWNETLDPRSYSAPRIAISDRGLEALARHKVDETCLEDDQTLLDSRYSALWLEPHDFHTKYAFVTRCVEADADSITSMTQDPACREITYADLVAQLGAEGQTLLDEAFPMYKGAGHITLSTDRLVRFHESAFEGVHCLYVVHSAIEYVFQQEGLRAAPCVDSFPMRQRAKGRLA